MKCELVGFIEDDILRKYHLKNSFGEHLLTISDTDVEIVDEILASNKKLKITIETIE